MPAGPPIATPAGATPILASRERPHNQHASKELSMERSAGILLHPTSLPSPYGIGDMGHDAYRWVDLLADHDQHLWQMCPLGPTGYGASPYQCRSSFAGNPLLIAPALLAEEGLLTDQDLAAYPARTPRRVDYDAVGRAKEALLHAAFERFVPDGKFSAFCEREQAWLEDYALYEVIRARQEHRPWYEWPRPLRERDAGAIEELRRACEGEVAYHRFVQYLFDGQWHRLKRHANERGVAIVGDIPYYCAYDSADAWGDPEILELESATLRPKRIAGVPPDYFSPTGQLWGNPVYDWQSLRAQGYDWWIRRIARCLALSDWLRIDHFRGFESFWAVPAGEETAVNGRWVPCPGGELFKAVATTLGTLPIIAEDLGLITPEVTKLRREAGFPGMKVIQFAFDDNPDNPYLMHNIEADSVVYTGTHDNNTTVGWYDEISDAVRWRACEYLGADEGSYLDRMLRMAYGSPADLCVIPLQDILGLGAEHRMNTPGRPDDNWTWRFTWEMVERGRLEMCASYTRIYSRARQEKV
jgi:4-alpha-glucanotransferase